MTDESTNGFGTEHEIPENERSQQDQAAENLAAEFAALGKRFGEAISAAWQSEERVRLQEELKDGVNRFAKEVDEAIKNLKKSEVGQKVDAGVEQAAADVKSGKVASEVRRATVTALRSLSEALDRMANSFTPYGEEAQTGEPGEDNPPAV
jgi:type IV secretory pathway TrbL component